MTNALEYVVTNETTLENLLEFYKQASSGDEILFKPGTFPREELKTMLLMAGFMNIEESGNDIKAQRPSFEIGSFAQLSITRNQKKEEEEIYINEDDLLEEEDLIKPSKESLQNPNSGCETKKKACKNCTCGRLEEEQKQQVQQQQQQPKSSCGSCYLGDAFRCASCPYLGLPAFKPGEKIIIANTADDDI